MRRLSPGIGPESVTYDEAREDGLSLDTVLTSVADAEVIEDYPEDRPYPSCLVLGRTVDGDPIHSVWAYNSQRRWAGHGVPAGPGAVDRLEAEEERAMMPFEQCPVCGGELVTKEVEKLLRGGVNTASLLVQADVCLRCGERYYPLETIRRFESIVARLERQEVDGFYRWVARSA